MQGHNSGLWVVAAIEIASVILMIAAWIVVGMRSIKSRPLVQALGVFGAMATTISLFIPFLFADLFAGRSGEAMLATLPLTLLGAPAAFILMVYVFRKLGGLGSK
jgi:hypothetical protein